MRVPLMISSARFLAMMFFCLPTSSEETYSLIAFEIKSEREREVFSAYSSQSYLTISGGVASCKSTVYGIAGTTTKIVVTQTLQVKDGMSWRRITDWSETFNSWYCSYPNSYSPIGSGTYRVKTVAKVYKGTSYETITVYSMEVS